MSIAKKTTGVSIIMLAFYALLVTVLPAGAETVRLVAGPWTPFTGDNLKNHGIAAKIVSDAFKTEGISTEYIFRPWKRAFIEADKGIYNGSILWRKTPDREEKFYYSNPVIKVEIVFFHLKTMPFEWKTLNDLKGYRIGAVNGLKYEDNFDTAMQSRFLKADYIATQEQNFKKLISARIDLTPVVRESGYATIKSILTAEEAKRITSHPLPLATHSLHLILTKSDPENKRILEIFNRGLAKTRTAKKTY